METTDAVPDLKVSLNYDEVDTYLYGVEFTSATKESPQQPIQPQVEADSWKQQPEEEEEEKPELHVSMLETGKEL
jgi:hypothetical protein